MGARGMGPRIRLQLSQHATLVEVTAFDGHCALICFEEIAGTLDAAIGIRHLKRKDLVWHNADSTLAREINRPSKRFPTAFAALDLGEFVGINQADFRMISAVEFERGHEVTDHKGVLQKETANAFVSSRPVHAMKGHVEVAAKSASPT